MSVDEKQKLGEVLARLRDGLQGLQPAIEAIDSFLPYLGEPKEPTWNPGKIKWSQEQGAKGPFEKSEDVTSLDFKEMLKDLAAHQGKLSRDGYFYWTFQNGSTVGRKKRQK
jgi:hypothetical protein